MTRHEHFLLADSLMDQAKAKLHEAFHSETKPVDRVLLQEHWDLYHQANKHYGIARAMWTREYKKITARTRDMLKPKEVKS